MFEPRDIDKAPKQLTFDAITMEVVRARAKFPGKRYLLAALMEETGELAKAYLQKKPTDIIKFEATQVACLAIRIIEEGDSIFDDITEAESKR